MGIERVGANLCYTGRMIKSNNNWVVTDRLGSVVRSGAETLRYFPWGEERLTSTQNRDKFGTYFRDSTGLDYALNRYYSSSHGRFLTPDPYVASASLTNPQSWNRYPYVENDPVNKLDPPGLAWIWANFDSLMAPDGSVVWSPPAAGYMIWPATIYGPEGTPVGVGSSVSPLPPIDSDGADRRRIAAALRVVSDCYWGDGSQYTVGYTRVITYQVLDQDGKPFYGSEVPAVTESVVTTSGPTIVGGGVWSRAENTIDPSGRFTDYLSANGNAQPSTATQTLSADGNALRVNIGAGSPTVLNNTYSTSTVTVNGTTSPRPCTDKDPR